MLLYQTSVTSIILTMCFHYTVEYTGANDHTVVKSYTNDHTVVNSYSRDHTIVNSSFDHPVVRPIKGLPHIDQYHGVNQTVQQGETAYIGCRVYNVGNR